MDYFKFIKANCANYVPVGPYQKKDYCLSCLPPYEDYQCLIKQGKDCNYFLSAVLPANKDLKRQWQDQHKPKPATAPKKKTTKGYGGGLCACGEEFERKTSRQKRCDACIKDSTRLATSDRQRKHRGSA